MPLTSPAIDDRRFGQLVDETLARARVHTPEWTNFNQSDPGVTLVQLFSFLTENLLYRANLTPERQRTKFLQLLRVPLAPASAATGLVEIRNERGPSGVHAIGRDLEVRAGAVAFRTQLGLDVLPLEARLFFKEALEETPGLRAYYELLYASYQAQLPEEIQIYRTAVLEPTGAESVDLAEGTVDGSLWIALLARRGEDPIEARRAIGGRTLTVGVVPALDDVRATLSPGGEAQAQSLLRFEVPRVPASRRVERDAGDRPRPQYRELDPRTEVDLLSAPGVAQLVLPPAADLELWEDVDPLEAGVGDMPPSLEDAALAARVVTWLRLRADGRARARIKWAGINVVPVRQTERVVAEPLGDGDGTPDQRRKLARAPVLAGSVTVTTRVGGDPPRTWREIDDLWAAPPEVPTADPRLPPSAVAGPAASVGDASRRGEEASVFELDAEAGTLVFGDGLRGRRLPPGARVFATYEYCEGAEGNVGEGQINAAPQLPSGFVVRNPVRTWGGADAETVDAGEKQVRRYLQHRDRLVSVDDIESIACRAPGVEIGRVEVLPAFHPDLGGEPGAAPGVVTLLAIPRFDPRQPDAPQADRLFLETLCRYLDPRRLVTTELVVRGPVYKGIWISAGVDVATGFSVSEVVEGVKARLRGALSPLGPAGSVPRETPLFTPRQGNDPERGWPLRTAVESRVLLAEVARVAGVLSVADVLLAEGGRGPTDRVEMAGLELPRVLGLSVVAGDPVPIDALRGDRTGEEAPAARLLPVPVVPETC
jgi:hypothetical protein